MVQNVVSPVIWLQFLKISAFYSREYGDIAGGVKNTKMVKSRGKNFLTSQKIQVKFSGLRANSSGVGIHGYEYLNACPHGSCPLAY